MLLHIFAALALIALGMGVDAYYQRRIRIAECDAYETGYQQGKKEDPVPEIQPLPPADLYVVPSMAAPVKMPDTFEERMRKHGRAVVKLK
jgi:hypothetical protein